MAFAASLADLQVQATCPICLDYLRDPVTIGCGHNFCHPCIQQCWEELQDFFPCPICLHHCLDRNFRRNTQLCHMTDIVKRLPIMRSKRKLKEKKLLCEKHHQILALFCEKDLELLCLQCRISPNHLGHHLMSIEQAATSHRRKLKSYIEPLRKKFEEAQRRFEMQVSKLLELKFKVENQKSELYSEFEHFLNFLEKEQGASHNRILNEEKGIVEKLTENRRQISDHRSTLNNLLSEITEKCVQADLDLLTGIGSIHNMCENLKTPKVFSYELKRESFSLPPQYFGLVNMISLFKENLTLDPK
ncbi:tripartite motif-containing protein 60-like, partial [Orycteropus afer afer]|uniref:Tripartite motif-containing protein 60-like n=1 Tax=Orycteropus afer afer TaxID=1230840 RepID=A0A8B7BE10_ORYAF